MNRDELLDRAVGKCVSVATDGWGACQTHSVGWAPAAFESGRCWKVAGEVKAVEVVLFFLGAEVEALRAEDPHNQPVRDAYDAVLELIDGGSE